MWLAPQFAPDPHDANSALAVASGRLAPASLSRTAIAAATLAPLPSNPPCFPIRRPSLVSCQKPLAMQVAAVLLAAISVVSVSAEPSWMPGQIKISEDFKVPGDNPLYFCSDPKDDILEIEKVDLD